MPKLEFMAIINEHFFLPDICKTVAQRLRPGQQILFHEHDNKAPFVRVKINPKMITGPKYYKISKYRNGQLYKISWYTEVSEKQSVKCLLCHDEVKPIVN